MLNPLELPVSAVNLLHKQIINSLKIKRASSIKYNGHNFRLQKLVGHNYELIYTTSKNEFVKRKYFVIYDKFIITEDINTLVINGQKTDIIADVATVDYLMYYECKRFKHIYNSVDVTNNIVKFYKKYKLYRVDIPTYPSYRGIKIFIKTKASWFAYDKTLYIVKPYCMSLKLSI